MFVDPARVRSPKDKPRVENQVSFGRADRKVVKIYFGTELIKMHERQPPGGRSTDPADYPADKSVYALRDVDSLRAKAKDKGVHIGIYADRLLGGPLPWTKMRQAYALLSLCEKYGDGRVERMCQSALAFDVVNVSMVAAMLKSAAKAPRPSSSGKVVQLPLPRFARPSAQFETLSSESVVGRLVVEPERQRGRTRRGDAARERLDNGRAVLFQDGVDRRRRKLVPRPRRHNEDNAVAECSSRRETELVYLHRFATSGGTDGSRSAVSATHTIGLSSSGSSTLRGLPPRIPTPPPAPTISDATMTNATRRTTRRGARNARRKAAQALAIVDIAHLARTQTGGAPSVKPPGRCPSDGGSRSSARGHGDERVPQPARWTGAVLRSAEPAALSRARR
jgi:hypothetical protein